MPTTTSDDRDHTFEDVIPSVYSNSANLAVGYFDFRILFSEMVFHGMELVQVPRVSVVMSPQHMKRFCSVMTKKLHDYEEQFGAIPEPPLPDEEESDQEENASPISE